MRNPTRILISICTTILLHPAASLAIDFGGPIEEDRTWFASDSPVNLTDDVRISAGATLTIESGVDVHLNGHVISTHWSGYPVGYLMASDVWFHGSGGANENLFIKPDDLIDFSKFYGVRVLLNANGGTLQNCYFNTSFYGIMVQGEWTITNCQFVDCDVGIWAQLNIPFTVRNCSFEGGEEGLHYLELQGFPAIDIHHCNFLSVLSGITVDGSSASDFIDATYNFWGDASGPTHINNPGGTGALVGDGVLYEPWRLENATPLSGVRDGLPTSGVTLQQNSPNPFNPVTKIAFDLTQARDVKLAVYSLSGRQVAILVDEFLDSGRHDVIWRGRDDVAQEVASGTYFYRLEVGGYAETKRMVLVK